MVEARDKAMMRAVVRRVHPDLFAAFPYEGAQNSESLKALNAYVDVISKGRVGRDASESKTLVFYVREEEGSDDLEKVEVELPANGSLGPLFYAFDLISREDLLAGTGSYGSDATDTNFLEWLQETVQDAVRTSDYHESLKARIREMRASIEAKHNLMSITLGGEYTLGSNEQLQHIDALKVLDTALIMHEEEANEDSTLAGLNVRLYHPDVTPMDTFTYTDDNGDMSSRTGTMQSYVGDDGVLHIVADRATIRASIRSFDVGRARLLTRLSRFWLQRVESLTPPLQELLRVDKVWADTRNEVGSQKFVLWAGALLERREQFESVLPEGGRFSFSILVHCDNSGPMVEFLAASCVLQVRADCPPHMMMSYLQSEAASLADQSAASASSTRELEEELLDSVRDALGAKHVIRVCSMLQQEKVLDGARRLLANADSISKAVNLTGASIALDDCYEVWESGFISIPYDFQISDLEPNLKRLLATSSASVSESDEGEDGLDAGSVEAFSEAIVDEDIPKAVMDEDEIEAMCTKDDSEMQISEEVLAELDGNGSTEGDPKIYDDEPIPDTPSEEFMEEKTAEEPLENSDENNYNRSATAAFSPWVTTRPSGAKAQERSPSASALPRCVLSRLVQHPRPRVSIVIRRSAAAARCAILSPSSGCMFSRII